MSRPDIEAIRNRANKATRGPWEQCNASGGDCKCGLIWSVSLDTVVAANTTMDELGIFINGEQKKNNAEFIANARTDIPYLLDYIEKLEKRIEKHKILVTNLKYFKAWIDGKEIYDVSNTLPLVLNSLNDLEKE